MPSGVVARWAHRKACVVLGVAGPVVGPAATTTPRGVCLGAATPAEWFGRHALVTVVRPGRYVQQGDQVGAGERAQVVLAVQRYVAARRKHDRRGQPEDQLGGGLRVALD